MKIRKTAAAVLLGSWILTSVTGCRVGNTELVWEGGTIGLPHYVFQINDKSCDTKLARLYLCNYYSLYGNSYGVNLWEHESDRDALMKYVKTVTLQELTRVVSMELLAKDQGMELTAKELSQISEAAEAYYDSLSSKECDYIGMHESDIQAAYEQYALANKLYSSLTDGIDEEVSDDEARVIRIQQIFVRDKDRAREVERRLAAGEEFAAVAGVYNDAAETDLTVAREELPQEVENVAFNLDNNQVSEKIVTEDGYYFIRCVSKLEEELTESNKDNIRKKRRMQQFVDQYDAFVSSASYDLNEEVWKDLVITPEDEITTDSFFEVYEEHIS